MAHLSACEPCRVLLIEDNALDAEMIHRAIRKSMIDRFEMVTVNRLEQALEQMARQSFDAVLLDLGLPDSSGIESFRAVRAAVAQTPVIILSGCDDQATALAAVDQGARDYLVKGEFTGDGVLRCVRHSIERARLEEQLRQSQKLEAIGALAGGISHEFNNLLQVIQGYASFAQEGLRPEDQLYEDLGRIIQAARQGAELTRGLLTFSRRTTLKKRPADMTSLVQDAARLLRPLLGARIELRQVSERHLPPVWADSSGLHQVVTNLCVNARDAMPDGGVITLTTQRSDPPPGTPREGHGARQYVLLAVADTGKGIAPGDQQRIFEPFFTTKEVGKGTGLGLSIVHGIVQEHHGTILVDSLPGRGTTIRIYLPADAPHDGGFSTTSWCENAGRPVILLAEDDAQVRTMAARVLSNEGYIVVEAADGAEAVSRFEKRPDEIDLVMLDVVMPKRTGPEAYRQIARLRPGVPVLFITGQKPSDASHDPEKLEGARVIRKPFTCTMLRDAVREALPPAGCPEPIEAYGTQGASR